MPTIFGLQIKEKDSYAYSHELGLILRSNGEEPVSIITPGNTIIPAGWSAPTVAPTYANHASTTGLTPNKYVVYKYVYAATGFLGILGGNAIRGGIAPRSNPSPQLATQIDASGHAKVITVQKAVNEAITEIWLFRTAEATTAVEAQLFADAGSLYYVGYALSNGVAGQMNITDSAAVISGNPLIELDNFAAPQFRFCVFDGTYFWGFGNQPYRLTATWDTAGVITTTPPVYIWSGREGQVVTFEGITTGGFDGAGSFRYHWLTNTTGYAYVTDSTVPATLAVGDTGLISINDHPNTLYRSKAKNPFAWGHLANIVGVYVPELWQLEIGSGGIGTAIAIVPDQPLLKVDLEFPAACEVFNLQAAATDQFANTQKSLSRVYSASCHFSQFHAVAQGTNVLWALDFKNYAILQSDGNTQQPVASPLNLLLRSLTRSRNKQLLAHGIYDSRTECNCIWVATRDTIFNSDICIYQHWPSGFWGVVSDYDILCSTIFEDIDTGQRKIYVGTETGFVAEAFVEDRYNNYLPTTGLQSGTIGSATSASIIKSDVANFNVADIGIIGNYVIVTNPDGISAQISIITGVTATTLTLDSTFPLSPVPVTGENWKFYIGMIECEVMKYFNFNLPSADKYLPEVWATMENCDIANLPSARWYAERSITPEKALAFTRDKSTDAYSVKKGAPTGNNKTIGIGIIDRSYGAFQISDITLGLGGNPNQNTRGR